MSKVSRMTGVPWHTEVLGRAEDDERRHRSRCVHYSGKNTGGCKYYCGRCRGAAHCRHYSENRHSIVDSNEQVKPVCVAVEKQFQGVKEIPMEKVNIDKVFCKTPPEKTKVEKCIGYFKIHGEFDKPIVVNIRNGKYFLEDGYARYIAAKRIGLVNIWAEMGTKEEIKARNQLRQIGTLVWNKGKAEVGEVIDANLSQVKIKFDDGQECTYDICISLQHEYIRPL